MNGDIQADESQYLIWMDVPTGSSKQSVQEAAKGQLRLSEIVVARAGVARIAH